MSDKAKRLNEVYEHLHKYCSVHTKGEFADIIKYARSYISSALNGNEKYLTEKLFKNICEAYPGTFNIDYLLRGTGQLLTIQEEVTTNELENQFNQPQSSYIDKLIASLEQQIKAKDEQIADKNHIIKLLEQKVEILEAMQHIDAENPLRSPFPVGVAEQKEQKESLRV